MTDFKILDTPDTDSIWDRMPTVGDILTEKTAFRLPSGSIVMADNHMAINKRDTAFYVGGQARATWDALQRHVRYEPIRVVRVGWSS